MVDENTLKSNPLLEDMAQTFERCLAIAVAKNADYAGEGRDPFRNFRNSAVVGVEPRRGVLVRLMDKMSRIGNLLDNEAKVKDEAIEDTIDDAINYLAILKSMVRRSIGREVPASELLAKIEAPYVNRLSYLNNKPTREGVYQVWVGELGCATYRTYALWKNGMFTTEGLSEAEPQDFNNVIIYFADLEQLNYRD